ncbi:hypothetical protein EYR40_003583 [Pleurotus pulmonarius]|nr:hypothetical protein EYR40_003583 [Pleurotus pulmonarius]KAF4606300.1 hypothetical protein EYR38_000353 [Pleurotus pulmonarius]
MAVLPSLDQGGSDFLLPAPIQDFGAQIAETYIPGAQQSNPISGVVHRSKLWYYGPRQVISHVSLRLGPRPGHIAALIQCIRPGLSANGLILINPA